MADPVYFLDTNICVYVLDDAQSLPARRLGKCQPGSAVISAITAAELSRWPGITEGLPKVALETFFRRIPIIPFDEAAAMAYARIPFRRGSYDRLIAAHALALKLILVSNNERDFVDVPGLKLENWTKA